MQWKTPRPLLVGSQFAFTAMLLGRTLTYTYEVVEFVPDRRFVMRTAEVPFPMETTYEWDDAEPESTRMMLPNRGEPSGYSGVVAHMMESKCRRTKLRTVRLMVAAYPPGVS